MWYVLYCSTSTAFFSASIWGRKRKPASGFSCILQNSREFCKIHANPRGCCCQLVSLTPLSDFYEDRSVFDLGPLLHRSKTILRGPPERIDSTWLVAIFVSFSFEEKKGKCILIILHVRHIRLYNLILVLVFVFLDPRLMIFRPFVNLHYRFRCHETFQLAPRIITSPGVPA